MPLLVEYFIINTPSVRLRRTATPFKKGELKTNTRPVIARSVSQYPVIARSVIQYPVIARSVSDEAISLLQKGN